jgi:hypothetical protein
MAYGDDISDADLSAMLSDAGDLPESMFESMISYATDPNTPLADVALIPAADDFLVDDDWDADDDDGSIDSPPSEDEVDLGHDEDGPDDSDDDYSGEF